MRVPQMQYTHANTGRAHSSGSVCLTFLYMQIYPLYEGRVCISREM